MAGIYFHFPFCRQACHYCNFHFSTQLKHQQTILKAFEKEISLRNDEIHKGWKASILVEVRLHYYRPEPSKIC